MPGAYIVETAVRYDPQTGVPDPKVTGSTPVVIGTADVNNFVLRAPATSTVQGTIRIEDGEWSPGPPRTRPSTLSEQQLSDPIGVPELRTPFAGLGLPGSPITGSYAAEIRTDATFEIRGLFLENISLLRVDFLKHTT